MELFNTYFQLKTCQEHFPRSLIILLQSCFYYTIWWIYHNLTVSYCWTCIHFSNILFSTLINILVNKSLGYSWHWWFRALWTVHAKQSSYFQQKKGSYCCNDCKILEDTSCRHGYLGSRAQVMSPIAIIFFLSVSSPVSSMKALFLGMVFFAGHWRWLLAGASLCVFHHSQFCSKREHFPPRNSAWSLGAILTGPACIQRCSLTHWFWMEHGN